MKIKVAIIVMVALLIGTMSACNNAKKDPQQSSTDTSDTIRSEETVNTSSSTAESKVSETEAEMIDETIVGSTLGLSPRADVVEGDISIMSYNVLSQNYSGGSAEQRADRQLAQIFSYKPDVVGLQEFSPSESNAWATRIANTSYEFIDGIATVTTIEGERDNWSPIIYNSATLTLLDAYALSYEKINDNMNGRVMSVAEFQLKKTGDIFIVINTHWNINIEANKISNANELSVLVADMRSIIDSSNIFVTGDFNCARGAYGQGAYETFVNSSGLVDAAYSAEKSGFLTTTWVDNGWGNGQPNGSYSIPESSEKAYDKSLDHIMYDSNAAIANYFTVIHNKSAWEVSDHYPVFATFNFK